MSKRVNNLATILSFISILLIPIGIALMWISTTWKKKVKILLTVISSVLYVGLIVLFFMLEPSFNNSGITLPIEYNKGYTNFESKNSSTGKDEKKKDTDKNSGSLDLDSIIDKPQTKPKLPNSFNKRSGGNPSTWLIMLLFFALILILVIIRNIRASRKSHYENPYVDTNLYKLPLTDDAKMPMVHFLRLQQRPGEKILFATETNQQNNEGNFVVTNQRVVILNKEENIDFPLDILEAISSVSNSVVCLTSGTRKYHIFMDESQVKFALAVVRWAYRLKTANN